MLKLKIEVQVTILLVIIGGMAITLGYLSYRSISEIVSSIHMEAIPDKYLYQIKDLASDLNSLENDIRLYILTNNPDDLESVKEIQDQLLLKIDSLRFIKTSGLDEIQIMDSLSALAVSKIEIWKNILKLHQSGAKTKPPFSEIYFNLEKQNGDTLKGTVNNREDEENARKKRGFLRRIFGRTNQSADTVSVSDKVEVEDIKQQLKALEQGLAEEDQEKDLLESKLIERNIQIEKRINEIITLAEKNDENKLLIKTGEADRLAGITYKRLAIFMGTSVILILVVFVVLFNFLKRTRSYQKVLRQAKQEAELLAETKENFAANVSHELRTPINAIYGISELIMQNKLDNSTRELVYILLKSAEHLKNVINDTLDFSKMQAGKLKLNAIDFDPMTVFKEVLFVHRHEANRKGIDLNFNWIGEKPEALFGDPLRLKQILINLLSNAIKYTEKGSVTLSVESVLTEGNQHKFNFKIVDTGIGIPKEKVQTIFEEYFQVETEEGYKNQGTGLGLTIVKKLVEMQNGDIDVQSTYGKGTIFSFSIIYPSGDKKKIGVEHPIVQKDVDYFKHMKFLIVDDSEYNRLILKNILKKWGAKFKEAQNGPDSIKLALMENFDVILMDIVLPGINGIDSSRKILKEKPDTVIIAVSASNEEKEKTECKKAGIKGFLLKPFSQEDLLNILIKIKEIDEGITPDPVDLTALKKISNDDDGFFREMIRLFIHSSEKEMDIINEALNFNDWETIREAAHKIAAPSKHIHALELYKLIKAIEKKAEKKQNIDDLKSICKLAQEELKKVNSFLRELVN